MLRVRRVGTWRSASTHLSPFSIAERLQVNINLPAYSGANCHGTAYQFTCGCPGAFTVPTAASPKKLFTGTLPSVNAGTENLPPPSQAAHLANSVGGQREPRPIHLLRVPSFKPPVFEDEVAPPPAPAIEAPSKDMRTPPPQYDVVVGTPSVNGLADYSLEWQTQALEDPRD
ncbi:hypothetical protein NW754_010317 [Fusarium falciforme]|nr:hypothetical protein NW754_010317 [Fusarium falciforme]